MANSDTSANASPFDEQELEHFKQLLQEEHQETKTKIEDLQASIDDINANSNDENSAAAHHQGDVGSEEDEREKLLIMLEKENEKIKDINEALGRIENGTYGVCLQTGDPIQKERLEAIPHARFSVKAQRENDEA